MLQASRTFVRTPLKLFLGVDFNSIKLSIATENSLLQAHSKDVNIEDDASTPLPTKDGSKFGDIVPSGLSK